MSQYDDTPTFPGYAALSPGSWDGTTEALAMGLVMEPPEGFLARAVARGLAVVEAEEALVAYREQRSAANDRPGTDSTPTDAAPDDHDEPVTLRPTPCATERHRHDSGVFLATPPAEIDRPE